MKIAPYLANTVQRTYQRQQRIGERIAKLKSQADQEGPRPAAEVRLSAAGVQAAQRTRSNLERAREAHLEELSGRFVERFLAVLEQEEKAPPPEGGDARPGRPSFDKILDNLGLAVRRNAETGEGQLVEKETGQVLIIITPEEHDAAMGELRALARDILSDLV